MQQALSPELTRLIGGLDRAVERDGCENIVNTVRDELVAAINSDGIRLPDEFYEPRGECYARRLLHRGPNGCYTVVVMTWGPGQGTPLHDHAGLWCVECVALGNLEVVQYDLSEQQDQRYRFEEQPAIKATVGDAGCLIPPYEYHILRNACDRSVAVTVHVYGGEMGHCHAFRQDAEGWWQRETRSLCYDN